MINENEHIIQFEYDEDLYFIFMDDDSNIIKLYSSFKNIHVRTRIIIYYNNLHIYAFPSSRYNNYNYIFNLSNMLYKLHTKDYYSGIQWNKGLI